uniref:Uncharacterized protein n=1 Tax=Anguilla anguilla TaxID=7936 RepID=A0A0E9RB24_ANGAN
MRRIEMDKSIFQTGRVTEAPNAGGYAAGAYLLHRDWVL